MAAMDALFMRSDRRFRPSVSRVAAVPLALLLLLVGRPHAGRGGNPGLCAQVDSTVEGFWRHEPDLPSLAVGVIHEGKTLYSRAFGFASCIDGERILASTATRYAIASCLKPMVAVALHASLAEERPAQPGEEWHPGLVPLSRWFGERAAPDLTVRDLLAHRVDLGGPVAEFPGALTVGGTALDCRGWETPVDPLRDGPPLDAVTLDPCAAPGTPCGGRAYSNDAYWVAGYVLTKITLPAHCPEVDRWPAFGSTMRRLVWGPLGMTTCSTEAACGENPAVARPHALARPSRARREDRFDAEFHRRFRAGPVGEAYASLDDMLRFARATTRARSEPSAPLAQALDAATRRMWEDERGQARRPGWLGAKPGRPDSEVWIYGIKEGYLAFVAADPEQRSAVCLLTNTGCDGCCRASLEGEPSSLLLRNRLQALAQTLMDLAGSAGVVSPGTLGLAATQEAHGYVFDGITGVANPVYKGGDGRLSVVREDRIEHLAVPMPVPHTAAPNPAQAPPSADPNHVAPILADSLPRGFTRDPELESALSGTWRGALSRSNRWSYLTLEWSRPSQGVPTARVRIGPAGTREQWDDLDLLVLGRREIDGRQATVLHGSLFAVEGGRALELLDAELVEGVESTWVGTWRHGGRTDHFVLTREGLSATNERRGWTRLRAGTWSGQWSSQDGPGGTLVLTVGDVAADGSRRVDARIQGVDGMAASLPISHAVAGWMDAEGTVRFSSPPSHPCAYHVYGAFVGDECRATIVQSRGASSLRLRRAP